MDYIIGVFQAVAIYIAYLVVCPLVYYAIRYAIGSQSEHRNRAVVAVSAMLCGLACLFAFSYLASVASSDEVTPEMALVRYVFAVSYVVFANVAMVYTYLVGQRILKVSMPKKYIIVIIIYNILVVFANWLVFWGRLNFSDGDRLF